MKYRDLSGLQSHAKMQNSPTIQPDCTCIKHRMKKGLGYMVTASAVLGLCLPRESTAQHVGVCDNYAGKANPQSSTLFATGVESTTATNPSACPEPLFTLSASRPDLGREAEITGKINGTIAIKATNGVSITGNTSFNNYQIRDIAAGTKGNDAVNIDQLKGIASGLGGGAGVNSSGGIIAPSYLVQGQSKDNVGGAISALDSSITSLSKGGMGLLRQAAGGANLTVAKDLDGAKVDFTGKFSQTVNGVASTVNKDRVLTGVAKGAAGNDAVNIDQLKGIASTLGGGAGVNGSGGIIAPSYLVQGESKNSVDGAIGALDQSISNLSSGGMGLLRQAAGGANLTVAKDLDGAKVDFTGKFSQTVNGVASTVSKDRLLTGVAKGAAGNDAVNIDQLKGIASTLGGGAGVNGSGGIIAPSYLVQGESKNSVGGAIGVLDQSISNLSSGGTGLLRQAAGGANLTVAKDLDGAKVDFTGKFSQTVNGVASTVNKDRVLTGVAKGEADNDAVNVRQLKDAGLIKPDGSAINTVLYDSSSKTRITFGGGVPGTVLDHVAPGLITADSRQAINGSQLHALQSNLQGRINGLQGRVDTLESKVHINSGDISTAGIRRTGTASLNTVGGDNAQGIGNGNSVEGDNSIGQGNHNVIAASDAIGIGNGNNVSGHRGIAAGNTNAVSGQNGVGIGSGTRVAGRDGIATGTGAQADGNSSVAIGAGAKASADDAVALGSNAVADRNSTVSVGSAGHERQIANVAAGTRRTDAANLGQVQEAVNNVRDWANYRLDRLDRRIAGMGAMSAASTQMAINGGGVEPGRGRVIAGAGFSGGQSALAVGYANAFNERVRFSIGGTVSNRSQTSTGIGIGVDL